MDWTISESTSNDQIIGQLTFTNEEIKHDRGYYATPCGGCICNKCANNVDGCYKPGEMKEPCFNCDDCMNYSGDRNLKDNWKSECKAFIITNYHAEKNRERIKLLR